MKLKLSILAILIASIVLPIIVEDNGNGGTQEPAPIGTKPPIATPVSPLPTPTFSHSPLPTNTPAPVGDIPILPTRLP